MNLPMWIACLCALGMITFGRLYLRKRRAAGRALDKEDPLYHGHLVRRGHATVTPVMVETLRGVLPAAK